VVLTIFSHADGLKSTFKHYYTTNIKALTQNAIENQGSIHTDEISWRASSAGSTYFNCNSRDFLAFLNQPNLSFLGKSTNLYATSPTEFQCLLPSINFFSNEISPLLFYEVSKSIDEKNVSIEMKVVKTSILGGPLAKKINDIFQLSSTSRINAFIVDENKCKIESIVNLQIQINLMKSNIKLPRSIVENSGNYILQNCLNLAVPKSLRDLQKQYNIYTNDNK
jgi:hypothetical protein